MAEIIFKTEPVEAFYDVKEELGRGNFAIVKRCKNKETGTEYAAKCITKKRSKASKRGMSKEAVEIEAGVLMALNHDAIIKLYDVFETKTNMTLVMELLTGGELFEEIAKEEFILEKDACFYVNQILSAVQHMHSQNIVHLDLKPENIVLKYPGSKEIKLIDFGLAKILDPNTELREMMGTPEFSAPEVINYDPVGPFTDMWAIGVVTYVLLSGASPFLGDDDQETYQNITSCDYQFDDEFFEKITDNAKDFIRKLLIKDAKQRNTIDDCLGHSWIAFEDEENSVIDTQKMRAFVARRRWKQSLKLVATISRLKMLYRNSAPSPPPDASGDDEDDTENDKDRKNNSCKGLKANLPNFTKKNFLQDIIRKDKTESESKTTNSFLPSKSGETVKDAFADNKGGNDSNAVKDNGLSAVKTSHVNKKDIPLSCEENDVNSAVTSKDKDGSSNFTCESSGSNSSVLSGKQNVGSEDVGNLCVDDHEKSTDCIEPAVKATNKTENLNGDMLSEIENQSSAKEVQDQLELLPSEDNPKALKIAPNADDHEAIIEDQTSSRIRDVKEETKEDSNDIKVQDNDAAKLRDSRQRGVLASSINDSKIEQNGSESLNGPQKEIVASEFQSGTLTMLQTESNSKNNMQEVDKDNTATVEQSSPIKFKRGTNISQTVEKAALGPQEHPEKFPNEKVMGGHFIVRTKGCIATHNTLGRYSGTIPDAPGKVENREERNSVSAVSFSKENTKANASPKNTVIFKTFTEIAVNGKRDTGKQQKFSTVKVITPLSNENAIKPIRASDQLSDSPIVKEVKLENDEEDDDDDMVVLELIHPSNNNS